MAAAKNILSVSLLIILLSINRVILRFIMKSRCFASLEMDIILFNVFFFYSAFRPDKGHGRGISLIFTKKMRGGG